MTTALSLAARTARLAVLKDLIQAGGYLDFYAGTPPATPDAAPGSTLLAHMALPNPVGAITQGGGYAVLTLAVPVTTNCVASGQVGWARFYSGSETGILDLPAGTEGADAPLILSALQVYTGGELQLLACVLRE
ncbi:MAG: hypothetical protein ACT4NV_02950 [Rhodoferax sp.]